MSKIYLKFLLIRYRLSKCIIKIQCPICKIGKLIASNKFSLTNQIDRQNKSWSDGYHAQFCLDFMDIYQAGLLLHRFKWEMCVSSYQVQGSLALNRFIKLPSAYDQFIFWVKLLYYPIFSQVFSAEINPLIRLYLCLLFKFIFLACWTKFIGWRYWREN